MEKTRASIITIGDEILIGQIVDTNSTWLGAFLSEQGIEVCDTLSVSDNRDAIKRALGFTVSGSDITIMTGGLGPTRDDVTKYAIAEFLGREMYFDENMYASIISFFEKLGRPTTEAHKRQCVIPEGAELLYNRMGTAPGMLFRHNNKFILSLPGVPYEMKWIAENSFLEFWAAENMSRIQLAYLPSLGEVKLRLTSRGLNSRMDELKGIEKAILDKLGTWVYGTGNKSIEEALMNVFNKKGKTLSTAESCTGGYIAHRITSVPGSSSYYIGSVVAYSYAIKEMSLGVSNETLTKFGAVSEETVLEMLTGLLDKMKTDVGIAVSGIAGPGGGTPTKPVGTVWLAWGSGEKRNTEKLQLGKDRMKNIEYTAIAAMNRLRLFLTQ